MILKKLLFFTLLFSLGSFSTTRAEVIAFNIDPNVLVSTGDPIAGGTLNNNPFNLSSIQLDLDGDFVNDVQFRTAVAGIGPAVDQAVADGVGGSAIILNANGNSFLNTPFNLGDVIGDGVDEFARNPGQFSVLQDGNTVNYVDGLNYLGLRFANGNFGYVTIDYDSALDDFNVTGGAFDNTGAAIRVAAVAVPEPSSLVAVVALTTGVVVRRRRQGRRGVRKSAAT